MEKVISAMIGCGLFASGLMASPTVSIVSFSKDQFSPAIMISYELTGGPAIVTLDDVLVKGESVGFANFRDQIFGDINARVSDGIHKIVWRADRSWPGQKVSVGDLKAKLSAWTVDVPPDYMVVDLVISNCYSYYSSTNTIPGGICSDAYVTDKIVMRRVPAKNVVWRMGSNKDEDGRTAVNEYPHYVKLTQDYWIGVFPITLGQFHEFNGGWLSDYTAFTNADNYLSLPMNYISYAGIRGTFSEGINWPKTDHQVTASSAVGRLRSRTGIMFDLPTDAQWEFACRAGTSTAFNTGKNNLDNDTQDIAYLYTTKSITYYISPTAEPIKGQCPRPVNYLKPNSWGIYDCHGNTFEWVLDAFSSGDDYIATFGLGASPADIVVIDPKGVEVNSSANRIRRGTSAAGTLATARSANRKSDTPGNRGAYYGFRVVCPIGGKAW